MNTLKSVAIAALSLGLLASCNIIKNSSYSELSMIKAPLNLEKKSPLNTENLNRWSHLDIEKDTIPGMSVDRAYAELLKNKKTKKIIVGIVDSGVDIEHEDLKEVIWTNKKEIPANGIDDDKNGYIDDLHGWNFLGDITKENLEYQRILIHKNLVDETEYQEVKAFYDKKVLTAKKSKEGLEKMLTKAIEANQILTQFFGKNDYSKDEVNALVTDDASILKSQMLLQKIYSFNLNYPEFLVEVQKEINESTSLLSGDFQKNNYRSILGDNPEDITDAKYGNNNVMGPDKKEILHGTHVAGIVAQIRQNGKGGDGILNNVEILTVRAVPDGDEYDKDIALGIRYAVDNGAKVINASFGKSFSPHKQWVYDAIKYAESKDVLIVHAAGNDSKDIDVAPNFPNDSDDKINEFAANMITVGALNIAYGNELIADFSNFGKNNVDVFAPGVNIYASTPNNTYQLLQGTSMASPNVAGVAALIRSYYPKLSAKEVKLILMDSGVAITTDVFVGGNPNDLRPFKNLCKSSKMVNAYNAILLAEKISKH